jgi:hypothetical protein
MYMYLCLYAQSWVFHGIQGNTPGAANVSNSSQIASLGRILLTIKEIDQIASDFEITSLA